MQSLTVCGIALCESALPCVDLESWKTLVDGFYRRIDEARLANDPVELGRLLPLGGKFAWTASSVTLTSAISEEKLQKLLASLAVGEVGQWIQGQLGPQTTCDLDEAWVRRQYAPGRYPRLHAPHGWHQDGALGFDFSACTSDPTEDAILPMVTCWIPLDACGVQAPGLEFVTARLQVLLRPPELNNPAMRGRFLETEFWRPALQPGDALLFRGDILHRTHVVSAMTADRTSIELRFFPAQRVPTRIKEHRFVSMPDARCS